MANPIKMPFGMWTRVGAKNHALDGVQIPHIKGQFKGKRASPVHAHMSDGQYTQCDSSGDRTIIVWIPIGVY